MEEAGGSFFSLFGEGGYFFFWERLLPSGLQKALEKIWISLGTFSTFHFFLSFPNWHMSFFSSSHPFYLAQIFVFCLLGHLNCALGFSFLSLSFLLYFRVSLSGFAGGARFVAVPSTPPLLQSSG